MKKSTLSQAIARTARTALIVPALVAPFAAQAATDAEMAALEKRIQILEQKLLAAEQAGALVVNNDNDDRIKVLEEKLVAAEKANNTVVGNNGRALSFKGDGYTFQVGGRLQLDAATYDEDIDGNDFGDGTKVRRAFVDLRGTLYDNWNYRLQYDFARPTGSDSGARGIRDAYLQYTGFKPAVTIGHFKEPFGLELLASSLNTTFIEPGFVSLFNPDRRLGVGVSDASKHWSYAAGIFGETAEGDVNNEGDEGWDLTGRVTFSPINEPGSIVHLGLAARQHSAEDSTNTLRFRERPGSSVTDVRLIDTNTLAGTDDIQFIGVEAAAVFGPASIQAEWAQSSVSRSGAFDDVDFSTGYIYGSWFLTGESRTYKNGVFDRISPETTVGQGGIGAWEVALRYNTADLTDGSIIGGEQEDLTLGVNWYATSNLRFAANYIKVLELDRSGSVYDGEELDSLVVRAQIDF